MKLTPMRYKDYIWPHNPETYVVEYQREMAAHKVPFGEYCLQDLGQSHRVLRGEGVFSGADAYTDFQELAEVFYQEGPGLLVHPVWQTASAYFVSLRLTEKPLPDYVRYAFTFWEDCGTTRLTEVETGAAAVSADSEDGGGTTETAYTVKKGDTLWAIAKRYDVTLTALINANPQIKNPNLIYPGDRVQIP